MKIFCFSELRNRFEKIVISERRLVQMPMLSKLLSIELKNRFEEIVISERCLVQMPMLSKLLSIELKNRFEDECRISR